MPLIAIIDWAASPLDDSDSSVERAVIGDTAHVKRFLCSSDADFNEEICDADALIVLQCRVEERNASHLGAYRSRRRSRSPFREHRQLVERYNQCAAKKIGKDK